MPSIERVRAILGERAKHLTDKEVEELCDLFSAIADIAIEQTIKELIPNSFPPISHE